jgi:hypothetical protein
VFTSPGRTAACTHYTWRNNNNNKEMERFLPMQGQAQGRHSRARRRFGGQLTNDLAWCCRNKR